MGVDARVALLRGYASRTRDFDFGLVEVLRGVAKAPCTRIGPRFIEKLIPNDEQIEVHLRGIRCPLFWPRALPVFDLYKVVTECFWSRDWHYYETSETQVESGDVVVDCGAAEGLFSLKVLDKAGAIVMFEPQEQFGSSLTRTFFGQPKAVLVSAAVGSRPGTASLDGSSLYGTLSPSGPGKTVRVVTLDDEVVAAQLPRVDFVKCDVESYELDVLRGAVATITRHQPKIALTVYHPGNDWREILAFVRSLVPRYQYRTKGLSYNGGKTRPVMIHLWVPPGDRHAR